MRLQARRPSPALVVALLALFFALSGRTSAQNTTSAKLPPVTGIHVTLIKSGGGTIMPDSVDTGVAHCPAGYFVLSGGWEYQDTITINTDLSGPTDNLTAWQVEASNPPGGQAGHAYAVAYCGKFSH
jgi:hypothetical protein